MNAMISINHGSRYIATNPDKTFPSHNDFVPGAGAMIASLNVCVDSEPEIIAGKPSTYLFEAALNKYGIKASDAIMVGDRFETDILGASELGIPTVLVRTGIASNYSDEMIENWKNKYNAPTYVVNNLLEILDIFEKI